MSRTSSGAARDRKRNTSSLETAWGSRSPSSRQRNHQARQDSGGLRTPRSRLVHQDQRTHETRHIIQANAKEIAPQDDIETNPSPFMSFEDGIKAAARRTCRNAECEATDTACPTQPQQCRSPSPLFKKDSKSPITDVSAPTEQARISEGGDRNTSLAGHGSGRGAPQDEDLPAQTNLLRPSKHQPDQRSQPAPSSESH